MLLPNSLFHTPRWQWRPINPTHPAGSGVHLFSFFVSFAHYPLLRSTPLHSAHAPLVRRATPTSFASLPQADLLISWLFDDDLLLAPNRYGNWTKVRLPLPQPLATVSTQSFCSLSFAPLRTRSAHAPHTPRTRPAHAPHTPRTRSARSAGCAHHLKPACALPTPLYLSSTRCVVPHTRRFAHYRIAPLRPFTHSPLRSAHSPPSVPRTTPPPRASPSPFRSSSFSSPRCTPAGTPSEQTYVSLHPLLILHSPHPPPLTLSMLHPWP
jgi:hypothetical protein